MASVNVIPVTVTFNPSAHGPQQFEWSRSAKFSLPAVQKESSFYALVITLDAHSAPGATWADPPIQWNNDAVPPPVPNGSDMPIPGANQIVIGIHNNNMTNQLLNYRFSVRVSYNDTVYISNHRAQGDARAIR
jgi:hypothetical protein